MTDDRRIVVGLDQGTTNTKVVALDQHGTELATATRRIVTASPRPGWVEQDPEAMVANFHDGLAEVLAATERSVRDVVALGICNQTESLVLWERESGRPIMPAIVWQCRRGSDEIAPLRLPETVALIRGRTGLDLDPTFTAAKLCWVARNRPEVAQALKTGEVLFGTVDCWLTWRLTGGKVYATDPGNASRTMLFDIDRLAWDDELFELFSLEIARRPECMPSSAVRGATDPALFGGPIAITGVLGDQQASLFGHGCLEPMDMKVTYGTGAFLWANAGTIARADPGRGIIRTIAWQTDRLCYAYEGFVMHAGAALDWLAARFGVNGGTAALLREAEAAGSSGGVALVPAFQGLASPWWRADARGALFGLTEATTLGNIAHAGLEAICFQIAAVSEVIREQTNQSISQIRIDGGVTQSRYFMQLQADVLQQELYRSRVESMSAYGAALMAGLGAGSWQSDDLWQLAGRGDQILPDDARAQALRDGYGFWRRATESLLALHCGQA